MLHTYIIQSIIWGFFQVPCESKKIYVHIYVMFIMNVSCSNVTNAMNRMLNNPKWALIKYPL